MRVVKTIKLLALIGVVLLSETLFFLPTKALATKKESSSPDDYCKPLLLKGIGEIDRNQTVNINGMSNPIYCTFKDKVRAVADLKKKIPEILSEIATSSSLKELSDKNWDEYRIGLQNLPSRNTFADERNIERKTLEQFFDIYENYNDNEKLFSKIEGTKDRLTKLSSGEKIEIGNLLPDYAPLAKESQRLTESAKIRSSAITPRISLPNINAAVAYAEAHATNPNENEYGYIRPWAFGSADCTNFVSQIVHAAGVGQIYYDNTEQGWWHRKNWWGHSYSTSWQRADTFARYMGVMYTTRNHYDFSSALRRGDIIAIDNAGDGNWDHMGFVTAKNNIPLCYANGDYYNYRVAQHSSDYLRWADSTNWPTATDNNGRLGRIRR